MIKISKKVSYELAYICGALTGDGHIQCKGYRGVVSFYSKNKYEIDNLNNKIKEILKVNSVIYKDKRDNNCRYKLFFISKDLARFFIIKGVPEKKKTNKIFFVPDWILNGNNNVKSSYLRGFYDTEGSIFHTKMKNNYIRWRINLIQNKNELLKIEGYKFMNQIKSMLNYFGINSSPIRFGKGKLRKDNTKSISILFDIEKSSFEKFYKHIGFTNKKKMNKLIKVINQLQV